jgi:hypothetical protein
MDGCTVQAGAKPIDRKKPTKSQKLSHLESTFLKDYVRVKPPWTVNTLAGIWNLQKTGHNS